MSEVGSGYAGARRVVYCAFPLAIALGFYQVAIAVLLPLEGLPISNLGAILTTLGLATVAASVPFAVLSDRYGRKHLMIVGAFLAAFLVLVPGFTSDFFLLELGAVAGGIGEAMYLSTWNAYLADATKEHERPKIFGLSFTMFTVAGGIGNFIPGLFPLLPLDLIAAHRLVFVALGIVALTTPLGAWRWAANLKPRNRREGILPRKSLRVIAKFSATNMMIGLGAGLIIPLMPTWFYLRYGVTDVFTGPLTASASIIMGLAALSTPTIAKRFGLVKGIASMQLLSTIFLIAIPFSPTPLIAAPLYVIRAVLMNVSGPLADTFLMNLIPEEERATASSFNVVIWRLPNAASTVVGGSLLESGNLNLPFYLCTVLYVSSITIFYTIFRGINKRTTQTTQDSLLEPR